MQLVHLKNIDEKKEINYELEASKIVQENLSEKKLADKKVETNLTNEVKNQLKSTNQIKTNPIDRSTKEINEQKIKITSFQEIINQSIKEKEIDLKYDLERNVKLVSFNKGKIDISFNEKLNKNFIKNLTEKLLQWTGERWVISLSKNMEAKSVYEKNQENKKKVFNEFKESNIAKQIENAFPDAELVDINES